MDLNGIANGYLQADWGSASPVIKRMYLLCRHYD